MPRRPFVLVALLAAGLSPGAGAGEPVEPAPWPAVTVRVIDAVRGDPVPDDALAEPVGTETGEFSGKVAVDLKVRPSAAWVVWEDPWFLFDPVAGVERIAISYPLHRATAARVRLVDGNGLPATGAVAGRTRFAADRIPLHLQLRGEKPEWREGPGGVHVLRPIPYVPGAALEARFRVAAKDAGALVGSLDAVLPPVWREEFEWTVRLDPAGDGEEPERDPVRPTGLVGIGGGGGPALPRATVNVRVVGRDGRPASGARIVLESKEARTDAEGRATFRWAADRDADLGLWLRDPDRIPAARRVLVPRGGTVDVELREPAPAALRVRVETPDGGPAALARLEVTTPANYGPWDLKDGVLRVDPYADPDGTRTFGRAAPGPARVVARWRGRVGETAVTLVESTTTDATIRLP